MQTHKKVAVFTGTRAEYGLLFWLLKDIQSDPDLTLQLLVSGMHLSPEFGDTYKQIEKDGLDGYRAALANSYDIILYSPTLTVGVSNLNDVDLHFHYDSGMSTDVSHQSFLLNVVKVSTKNNKADTISTPRSAPNTIPKTLSVPDKPVALTN